MKFTDKVRKWLRLPIFIGNRMMNGWSEVIPHYNVYCEKHGWIITYPSGHYEKFLCPECLREQQQKERDRRLNVNP